VMVGRAGRRGPCGPRRGSDDRVAAESSRTSARDDAPIASRMSMPIGAREWPAA
jgi:hypothetical protein